MGASKVTQVLKCNFRVAVFPKYYKDPCYLCYMRLYEVSHPPVLMEKTLSCRKH